jgi:hypothetical protein
VASRDLESFPLGRHQYLILIPQNPGQLDELPPDEQPQDLGADTRGIVISAGPMFPLHKGHKQLRAGYFADADLIATEQCLNPNLLKHSNERHFHPRVLTVSLAGTKWTSIDKAITAIIDAANYYNDYERNHPIDYPFLGGVTKKLKHKPCYNSNSWAQSIIQYVVGPGAVQGQFPGGNLLNLCQNDRIPPVYFTPLQGTMSP